MRAEFEEFEKKSLWYSVYQVSLCFLAIIPRSYYLLFYFFRESNIQHPFSPAHTIVFLSLLLHQEIKNSANEYEYPATDFRKPENRILNRYSDVFPCKFRAMAFDDNYLILPSLLQTITRE